MDKPKGTVTFLLADLVGSTQLWEEFPDVMADFIPKLLDSWKRIIEECGGHTVKTMGDGILAAFGSAPNAFRATVTMHGHAEATLAPNDHPIGLRAGLNSDVAVATTDDYFGQVINRLSRLLGLCNEHETVVSAAARELCISAVPPDWTSVFLGPQNLRGVSQPIEVFLFYKSSRQRPTVHAVALPQGAVDLTLPFVGRKKELAEIKRAFLVDHKRLLTLTGPGGIGKSRLAFEASSQLSPSFSGGTFFVDCSQADSLDGLGLLCLGVLGCSPVGSPQELLLKVLQERNVLLILDGFEHVVQLATFVSSLIARCPSVRIIVTSRIVLGLSAETELALSPFGVSSTGKKSDSRTLFLEAAGQVARLKSDKETTQLIDRACVLLDGVPLLLRLAGSRLRAMSLLELVESLQQSRLGLGTRERDSLPKHANVRRVITDSIRLLGEDAYRTLKHLSIFEGGFTAKDVSEVLGADLPTDYQEVLEVIREHSLLQTDTSGSSTRYRLLDSIREFASEDHLPPADTKARFVRRFANVTLEIKTLLDHGHWRDGHQALLFSMANLRKAVRFAENGNDPSAVETIGPTLARVYLEAGMEGDFDNLAATLISQSQLHSIPELHLQILGMQGARYARSGKRETAKQLWEERLGLAEKSNHEEARLDSLIDLAGMAISDADWKKANGLLNLAKEQCLSSGLSRFYATIEAAMSEVALGLGDSRTALKHQVLSLKHLTESSDDESLYVLRVAAEVALAVGDHEQAVWAWNQFVAKGVVGRRWVIVRKGLQGLAQSLQISGRAEMSEEASRLFGEINDQLGSPQPVLSVQSSTDSAEYDWEGRVIALVKNQ